MILKNLTYILVGFITSAMIANVDVHAQQARPDSIPFKVIGYEDKNHDGINDRFADANGDGKNDVTLRAYAHTFKFEDKNNDGLNDLWIDKDGDGVNDLFVRILKHKGITPKIPWVDKDGDGIQDTNVDPQFDVDLSEFVLDADQDKKNDITGLEISHDNVMGYRYGVVDEENNKEIARFVDKDSDGMHDVFSKRLMHDLGIQSRNRRYDYFIDSDGDGISDGRGFQRKGKRDGGQHGRTKG
ncbi:hypothetical protein JXJ21_02405 [candidate division KSB1 bacterium]|nr:hypothetical protein [candidate division KSB1 bacterium]